MNIYLDGVFDLFHVGHLRSFKYIKEHYKNCKLYIGVVCDKDVEGYKRKPIINEEQRCEIIEGIKYVDKVIFPAPLVMTEDFLKMNNIDLVVHGFISNEDRLKQEDFFKEIRKINKFEEISYNNITSTTKIINACISQNIYKNNLKQKIKN
tara:strand:+ start:991 stop:1443 length:453 start_codon:yes stop_codon:yes gene_type:complete